MGCIVDARLFRRYDSICPKNGEFLINFDFRKKIMQKNSEIFLLDQIKSFVFFKFFKFSKIKINLKSSNF